MRPFAAVLVLLFAFGAPAFGKSAADEAANASLVKAATEGDVATVKALLATGADPNSHDAGGLTALNWAAYKGNAAVVRMLLAKHATVDSHGNASGWTPLMNAAAGGYDEVVSLLLAGGASVNAKDAGGESALWFASVKHHASTVALLRPHGATGDFTRILAGQELCAAAREPLGDADITWELYADKVQAGCRGGKHDFPGGPGAVIMYTYAVDGDRTGAQTLSITVNEYNDHLSKDLINATLQPLLRNLFATAGGATVPSDVTASAASLSNLQSDSALGHVTAYFKPRNNGGGEYRMAFELK